MTHEHAPLIALPAELSDEAAAQLIESLHQITTVLEKYYAGQLQRYYHPIDERQQPLWPENDPPF